ncbi:MAG: RNA polymerase sigma factor, partial [Thermoleophilia bacterium]
MPGMDLSDNELAVLAGRGDAEAYRRLFDRYQHPVYNFVYRMVDNAEDAADIVQDALIRMYSVLGAREVQNFSAYLYRTAKNLAYDEMRRRSRFVDV